MTQAKFKSRDAFLEWRAHWRKDYAEVTQRIRGYKTEARKPTNNSAEQAHCNRELRRLQTAARSLMIAREAAAEAYALRKQVTEVTRAMAKQALDEGKITQATYDEVIALI